MNHLVKALVPLLLLSSEANAEFSEPVINYINQNDERALHYAIDRCVGLLVAALDLFSEEPQVAASLQQRANVLYVSAVDFMLPVSASREEARQRASSTVQGFSLEYIEGHMNSSYIRSGNYLDDPIVQADLPACSSLAEVAAQGTAGSP